MSKNDENNRNKDVRAFNCSKQITRLYTSSVLSELSLTGAWVAILAARGFSMVEIGIVEMVFHITSLLFEIPSGVLADVFGRKKMLVISAIMRMLGCFVMIASNNLELVCISIAFFATSYNFTSGSGDALAYDSLKYVNRQGEYVKYESNQLVIYRLCEGMSTLGAGLALLIGYRLAYSTSFITCVVQLMVLSTLVEVGEHSKRKQKQVFGSIMRELMRCVTESLEFLKTSKKAIFLMFCNSFVGAIDILLLFFLQAKLPQAGMPSMLLGVALFVMQLGGIIGARIILYCRKIRYQTVFAIATLLVLLGVILEHSGCIWIMVTGGFIAAMSDDALQVRTNTKLQHMFPSKQRATLISVESFTFSVIMIVMSPLAGILFSWW